MFHMGPIIYPPQMSHRSAYMSDSWLLMSGEMSVGPDFESADRTLNVSIEQLCGMIMHIQMDECPRKNAQTVVIDEHTFVNTNS